MNSISIINDILAFDKMFPINPDKSVFTVEDMLGLERYAHIINSLYLSWPAYAEWQDEQLPF